jgi:cellulose synthase/poly-beta-1,6-N-acetylglucosamine synthase-like glycosyltransferase
MRKQILALSTQQTTSRGYVLVTPARNEADHIEKTIHSVVSQTLLPKQWVIVSDGSTDRTDEIVNQYAQEHDFIQLLRIDNNRQRDFASKVYAQQEGIRQVNGAEYDFDPAGQRGRIRFFWFSGCGYII